MNMLNVKECNRCELCKNQSPLLDEYKKSDVMWVGLSAKKVDDVLKDYPLQNDTNSGKLIERIEKANPQFSYYKTNLVKCLPLDGEQKLRYPTQKEMEACLCNLVCEINEVNPKVVVLLGGIVSKFVLSKVKDKTITTDTKFVSIEHPSYISVYKRKFEQEYIDKISSYINENISCQNVMIKQ